MGIMGKCLICKLIKLIVGIGSLNVGLVALFNINLVELAFGGIGIAKIVYIIIGVAGVMVLLSLFKSCPCINKES